MKLRHQLHFTKYRLFGKANQQKMNENLSKKFLIPHTNFFPPCHKLNAATCSVLLIHHSDPLRGSQWIYFLLCFKHMQHISCKNPSWWLRTWNAMRIQGTGLLNSPLYVRVFLFYDENGTKRFGALHKYGHNKVLHVVPVMLMANNTEWRPTLQESALLRSISFSGDCYSCHLRFWLMHELSWCRVDKKNQPK